MDKQEKLDLARMWQGAAVKAALDLEKNDEQSFNELIKTVAAIKKEEDCLWPEDVSFAELCNPQNDRDEIIKGLFEKGDVLSLSAPSKARKTYTLINFSLCLLTGTPWMDLEVPKKRKVMYINFELKKESFVRRMHNIINSEFTDFDKELLKNFTVISLRGLGLSVETIVRNVRNKIFEDDYDIVIFDPLYKMLISDVKKSIDENSTSDMEYLISLLNTLCKEGPAVMWDSHYTKSQGGSYRAMDRMAGSGVQAREPDCIMTMSEIEEKEGEDPDITPINYKLEFTIRDFAPKDPIGLRWEYPVYRTDISLAGAKIKGSSGRKCKASYSDYTGCFLNNKDNENKVPLQVVMDELGIGMTALKSHIFEYKKSKSNPYNFYIKGKFLYGKMPYFPQENSTATPEIEFDGFGGCIPVEEA
jgi:RecA-family ATPase